MSDFDILPPASPTDSKLKIDHSLESLTDPFEMVEAFPHIFISSWPTHIPANITNTPNLSPKQPVSKNGTDGVINHWDAVPKIDFKVGQSSTLLQSPSSLPHTPSRATSHTASSAAKSKNGVLVPGSPALLYDPPTRLDPSPPSQLKNILVYCDDGRNCAAAAVLAYMCAVTQMNVVDAFLILKKKKKDISPSERFLQHIQHFISHGEKFENVEKEIVKRLTAGFGAVMKKAESEDWKYEAGKC